MDKLSGLNAFVKAAQLGSYVAAAHALDLSPSAVGKAVARLEESLGVRLLQRSTRRIRLTEEGRLLLERGRRILDDLDDAHAMLSQSREQPRGRLRISAPVAAHHFLLPLLPAFIARHPEVELDLDFSDRIVDLIDEGVDLAIRGGELADSRLVSRALRPYRLMLCAAPAYLARAGTPRCAQDLDGHAAIRFRFPNAGRLQEWPELGDTRELAPRLVDLLTCNNMEALLGATLQGLGIGCMPDFLVQEALADGRLRQVLPGLALGGGRFSAVWPSSRHLSPKVRLFVDHLAAGFAA